MKFILDLLSSIFPFDQFGKETEIEKNQRCELDEICDKQNMYGNERGEF